MKDLLFAEKWKLSEARIALATMPNDSQNNQPNFLRVSLDGGSDAREAT